MKDKILIDSSVWIDFFRNKDSSFIDKIELLLKSGRAVYTGIIVIELINGAKGKKELQVLENMFGVMEMFSEKESTHLNTGKLGYEIARKGYTLGVVDLLIAQIAMENNLSLLTMDEHFKIIAKYSELRLE